jgi:hypothetical protein
MQETILTNPKPYRLTCIQPCLILNAKDATKKLVEFSGMTGTPVFVQIGVMECSVEEQGDDI